MDYAWDRHLIGDCLWSCVRFWFITTLMTFKRLEIHDRP